MATAQRRALNLHIFSNTYPLRTWYRQGIFNWVPRGETYKPMKRAMDLILGSILLIIAAPILIVCAIAVRVDTPGPAIFIQERTGSGGKRFRMFKFRTMVKDADSLKEKYQHLNRLSYPDFKISNDPRITRLGHFLRKTSLDELPQIFNVLLGNMSLVGPRPTSFPASVYDLWHTGRLEIKPGITGLWQISGRSDIDFDERVRLDIAYIRNVSLWLDVAILFGTVACVLSKRGAE